MNSSGIKRGLAGSAITALAISGLPFLASSASAVPGQDYVGADDVALIQPGTDAVSGNNDGQNNTVRLTAAGGTGVQSVDFYYQVGEAAPVLIGSTTRNDNGFFAVEWNPAPVAGGTVDIFAVESGSDADAITAAAAGAPNFLVNNNLPTVNLNEGGTVGVFQSPYGSGQNVIVDGTASSTEAEPTLQFWDPSAGEWKNGGTADSTTAANATTGTFEGVIDISGYDYSNTGDDDLITRAVGASTDDAEAFDLYKQTITTVTAEADRTNVPVGDAAEVTVTVTDQNGNPIAGARVAASNNTAVDDSDDDDTVEDGSDSDNTVFTDRNGEATFTQTDGTSYFYADATAATGYQANQGDKRSEDIAVTGFLAEPTSLDAESDNGTALDYNASGEREDLTVQVKDQNGNDVDVAPDENGNSELHYYYEFTPFASEEDQDETRYPASDATPVPYYVEDTDNDGEFTLELPNETRSGTWELFAALTADDNGNDFIAYSKVLEFKAGQAEIEFDEAREEAPAGGSEEVAGTLKLEDGTGLAGRRIALSYAGGDAKFDQTTGPDLSTRTVTTGQGGAFSATLDDPEAPAGTAQAPESGAVTANTANAPEVNPDQGETDTDNPGSATAINEVIFFNADAPEGAEVNITGLAATNASPGEAQSGTVTVTDEDGDPISGVAVTLTVDGESFFTSGDPDPAPANGGDRGELESLGQEIVVITGTGDEAGQASFKVSIEGSDEFDDDGLAEDIVTATISTDSDTEDVDYTTATPLNGGEVIVELAADRFQDSGVLPLLPTTDDAAYEVTATDQFGNPVGGVKLDVQVDGVGTADVEKAGSEDITTDFDENVEFYVSSDVAGDSTPVVTWDNAPVAEYNATGGNSTTTQRDIEGEGPTVEFYEVDFSNSTYTLEQQGPETRPVGSTVIMDYTAVDQNGEPIEFFVNFFRTGPDEFGDGEANNGNFTGEDGRTSYVFQGAAEGTATVTAIGYEAIENNNGDLVAGEAVPESQVTDTVTFGDEEPPVGPNNPDEPIIINISGDDNGGSKDVVRALVTNGEAETIKLFKIRGKVKDGNRRLKQVREDVVPEGGNLTFKVADRNGNKKTRFIAKVSRDAQDGPENFKSNTQKIR
ncbi:hypothetical protein [uncultured Nocardioides sp.]|uniref:hypothetical protein n=1 Tax=uncultured Nocardioides sp. TaxID=198441 RepID=UPI0030FB0A7A